MRGKERIRKCLNAPVGITPAYAGKRKQPVGTKKKYGDHPRVCGEKLTTFDSGKLIPGSPPRMRGKVVQTVRKEEARGITPAYAGKSWIVSRF